MTIQTVVVVLLLAAPATWLVYRWQKTQEKRVNLEERKVRIEEARAKPPPEMVPDPMPPILSVMAQGESESWAREDSLRAFQEAHTAYHDWNRVAQKANENAQGAKWEIVN